MTRILPMFFALIVLVACDVYDGPPEPRLDASSAGLLSDPNAPIVVSFDKPFDPKTLNLKIARYLIDDRGRLADETGNPNGKLSLLFSHTDGDPDFGGDLVISADGRTATITPKTAMPITPRLVLVVEAGLADAAGTTTQVRRKIVFGYQFALSCNKPSLLLPTDGKYFFLIDVKQPVGTQVKLFASMHVDPQTGAFKAQFVRATRDPDPNRCPTPCKSNESCRLLPAPACVVPSERAGSVDEYPDFIADATSPVTFQFTTTGCVVDRADGTADFVNLPVDVFVTSPVVTLRNTRLTSQWSKDAQGALRVNGALSAEDVLLGTISSGQGVGGLAGLYLTSPPSGIPDPP